MYLSAGTTTLLLLLTWGGVTYPWASPLIVSMAAASALLFFLLVRQERRAAEPVFSPAIFRNKVFVIASLVIALTFMALLGTAVFLPLYFQLVLGFSPSRAGLMMAPMTIGLIFSSFLGGRLVSRTGRYKIFPVLGLAFVASALLGVMWSATVGAGVPVMEGFLTLLGLGFGFVMPNLTVAIQNAVDPHELGMATATAGFFRSLGGAFGVALSGAIVTMQLHHMQLTSGGGAGARSLVEQGIQQIAQLPVLQRDIVLGAYRSAISTTFLAGAAVAVTAFAIALFLPEKPLKTSIPRSVAEGKTLGQEMSGDPVPENAG
jgi:MFS family permease